MEARAGLHAGEIELRGDDVSGLAVHIGARIGALAAAGEVLVSGTVRDLVVGSDSEGGVAGFLTLTGPTSAWPFSPPCAATLPPSDGAQRRAQRVRCSDQLGTHPCPRVLTTGRGAYRLSSVDARIIGT